MWWREQGLLLSSWESWWDPLLIPTAYPDPISGELPTEKPNLSHKCLHRPFSSSPGLLTAACVQLISPMEFFNQPTTHCLGSVCKTHSGVACHLVLIAGTTQSPPKRARRAMRDVEGLKGQESPIRVWSSSFLPLRRSESPRTII